MRNASEPGQPAQIVSNAAFDGMDFQHMLREATAWLDHHAPAIDAINVFPVPDGDTGRNMAQTLRAACEGAAGSPMDAPLSDIARAAAAAALLGARGNSGVILSQWLQGLARGLDHRRQADATALATALARASESAYAAIEQSREGTILSVARAAADCDPSPAGFPVEAALDAAVARSEAAVARTPEQMPLLAEAGVVDAGAQGLAVVLAGFHRGLLARADGESEPAAPHPDFGQINPDWLAGAPRTNGHDASFGVCTEFVLSGDALDLSGIRHELDRLGDSLVVAGDERLARVHLHTAEPEAAFQAARRFGRLDRCTTDDMDARHTALVRQTVTASAVAVVAVASGDGFARLFRELGAAIVDGGATHNPSAAEIIAAARRSGARDVIVLPNDASVISAARQAALLADDVMLHLVPTTNQPAAVAALTAWDPAAAVEEARDRMTEAASGLLTGSVTRAARAIDTPLPLRRGQPFTMLGDEIVAAAESVEDAVEGLISHMTEHRRRLDRGDAELLTIYAGDEVQDTGPIEARLRDGCALELEIVMGGQPHYPFLVSLE